MSICECSIRPVRPTAPDGAPSMPTPFRETVQAERQAVDEPHAFVDRAEAGVFFRVVPSRGHRSQWHYAAGSKRAPVNQARGRASTPRLQTGQARPGALGSRCRRGASDTIRVSRSGREVANTAAPDGLAPSELKVRSYPATKAARQVHGT
jgi:hypothetical protein